MQFTRREPIFENRYEAGRQLAQKLMEYKGKQVVVMAIPNGGAPVGLWVALNLEAPLDLVISRKIPLPLSPEGGFGAVTDDGTMLVNDEMVKHAGLTPQQISYQVSQVRQDIRQRSLLYHREKPHTIISGKTVLLVDDGMASGYTMMAAVESLRHRRAKEIVAAVPVASEHSIKAVEKIADRVITCAAGEPIRFYISDYYRYWHEPADDEVIQCFREWHMRRRAPIELNEKKITG